ncbi:DUF1804 family protein [Pantoea sp. BAV 3049]|uniref:DUF1804 family protein n=1 Tax=Pantoea sp. BAV 3049 TaxID=2654188 RepID=UPI00131C98CD|nr:DUF1804 family protein [Pantoea sp. BAV 3049]
MAHSKEVRAAVRRDYISKNIAPEVLGPMHGVSIATVLRWRRDDRDSGDDWDKHRAALRLSGGSQEEAARALFVEWLEHQSLAMNRVRQLREAHPDGEGLPVEKYSEILARLADGFNKMMAASRRILPETDRLIVAAGVVEEFAAFLSDKHPALMARFLDVLPEFQQIVEKKYG